MKSPKETYLLTLLTAPSIRELAPASSVKLAKGEEARHGPTLRLCAAAALRARLRRALPAGDLVVIWPTGREKIEASENSREDVFGGRLYMGQPFVFGVTVCIWGG